MKQLIDYEERSINKLGEAILDERWSIEGLLQLIALAGNLINLETIPKYQLRTGLSYNGVKNHRKVVSLFGARLVADPD